MIWVSSTWFEMQGHSPVQWFLFGSYFQWCWVEVQHFWWFTLLFCGLQLNSTNSFVIHILACVSRFRFIGWCSWYCDGPLLNICFLWAVLRWRVFFWEVAVFSSWSIKSLENTCLLVLQLLSSYRKWYHIKLGELSDEGGGTMRFVMLVAITILVKSHLKEEHSICEIGTDFFQSRCSMCIIFYNCETFSSARFFI